jgi:hypothetical protein
MPHKERNLRGSLLSLCLFVTFRGSSSVLALSMYVGTRYDVVWYCGTSF